MAQTSDKTVIYVIFQYSPFYLIVGGREYTQGPYDQLFCFVSKFGTRGLFPWVSFVALGAETKCHT